MKYIVIAGIVISAFSYNTLAQTTQPKFSMTIENENATVSPGGQLKVKVQGDALSASISGDLYVAIDTSVNGILVHKSGIYYHQSENKSHPRYIKITIKKDISHTLPITATLKLYKRNDSDHIFDSETFYVIEGTSGHYPSNVLSGHYYETIHPKPNQPSWYEIFCISSLAGYCSINIKNGDYDIGKYHGRTKIQVHNHNCSDSGYPGTSRLDVRDPLVFNASKMLKKKDNFNAPDHHEEIDIGACIITSNHPFFIRRVYIAKQKKSTPSL